MTKHDREIMDILAAFDLTGCAHSAAQLAGVDPKTVAHYVGLRDAGAAPEPSWPPPAPRRSRAPRSVPTRPSPSRAGPTPTHTACRWTWTTTPTGRCGFSPPRKIAGSWTWYGPASPTKSTPTNKRPSG